MHSLLLSKALINLKFLNSYASVITETTDSANINVEKVTSALKNPNAASPSKETEAHKSHFLTPSHGTHRVRLPISFQRQKMLDKVIVQKLK